MLAAAALAVPHVTIDAEADPQRGVIQGHMTLEGSGPVALFDPLASLPMPDDDFVGPRTFPGVPEQGFVRWGRVDEDTWWFYTVLPRRYEDTGSTSRFGLFANGGWYPQALLDGGVLVVEWNVTVRIPEGSIGAVGDQTGQGVLRWNGIAERASLAVLPKGRATPIVEDGLDVVLLTRRKPRKVLLRELATQLDAARPVTESWRGAIVEAPLRRRLVRPGAGLAYVSDRAYRVTPGLQRFHRVSVTRGVVQSLLFLPDPYEREIAAAALSWRHQTKLAGTSARSTLGYGAWIPGIHALLYDRRLPFVADVLEEPFPGDPLPDDLLERLDPHTPGAVVIAQIHDAWGPASVASIGEALLLGLDLDDASESAGVPPSFVEGWRAPYPQQDYAIAVESAIEGLPGVVTITRLAGPEAPQEILVVEADDERVPLTMAPGPEDRAEGLPSARRLALDPDGHVRQTSTRNDRWPKVWLPTASAWIATINLQEGYAVGGAYATLRRFGDTHHLWSAELYTDRQTRVGSQLSYVLKFGPLVDGLTRRHRVTVGAGPAWLDARFAPDDDARFALDGTVGYTWDNRVSDLFPVIGGRLSLGADIGVVPGTDRWWGGVSYSGTGLVPLHPRHVLAGNVTLGAARGDVPQRLLALGGETALRSLSPDLVGNARVVGRAEYRVAPIRNASVPIAGLIWGSELQLTVGAEAGGVAGEGFVAQAAGVTLGAGVAGDLLGLDPAMLGVTVAWPLWVDGVEKGPPQVYLRGRQAF